MNIHRSLKTVVKISSLKVYLLVLAISGFSIKISGVTTQGTSYNKIDTVTIMALIQKARISINNISFDSGVFYARKAIKMAERIDFKKGIAYGYHRISQAFDFSGASDSAIRYAGLAYKHFLLANDSIGLAHNQFTYGNIYLYKSWFETALKYYLNAYQIYYSRKDSSGMNDCHGGMGLVYYYTNNYRKSIDYQMLTVAYERKTNDEEGLPETYGNIGCCYYQMGSIDSAKIFYKMAEKIALKMNNLRALTAIYNDLGKIAIDNDELNEATRYIRKSIDLKSKLSYNEGLGENYINLGRIYAKSGAFKKAAGYLILGINYSKQFNAREELVSGYSSLFELYEKHGNISDALEVYKMYIKEKDTLATTKYNNQVAQWQTLYDLKNQEFRLANSKNEIAIQKIILQKNKIFQKFLIALIVVLILASVLIYRNIHQKRIIVEKENEIQKHAIRELEKEKMLLATKSVLKGEETERKRLARDLHDGLGGLLSGIKIALNNMKGNVVLTSESVNDFNHALGMLDNSIAELRRVAHNMMPETLMKLGLKDALSDFCTELNKVNPMNITFQFIGQFERVDSNLEINAYRIIQELVNNAVKHSEAKELMVQMIQEPKRLCFIVLDNGKGFDHINLENNKGVGLNSIKSRVDSFNGQLEINSKPGKGTEVTVEFCSV